MSWSWSYSSTALKTVHGTNVICCLLERQNRHFFEMSCASIACFLYFDVSLFLFITLSIFPFLLKDAACYQARPGKARAIRSQRVAFSNGSLLLCIQARVKLTNCSTNDDLCKQCTHEQWNRAKSGLQGVAACEMKELIKAMNLPEWFHNNEAGSFVIDSSYRLLLEYA